MLWTSCFPVFLLAAAATIICALILLTISADDWYQRIVPRRTKGLNRTTDIDVSTLATAAPSPCDAGLLRLGPLLDTDLATADNPVFLLETSKKSTLPPRTACSVESAARRSGVDAVVVMVRQDHLNLTHSNACKVYEGLTGLKIFCPGTPLLKLYREGRFNRSKHKTFHLSDALRLAYVSKHGGWYLDTDFIILKELPVVRNALAATAISKRAENSSDFHITNGAFRLDKKHPLLEFFMLKFPVLLEGLRRDEVGPGKLTKTLRQLCNLTPKSHLIEINSKNESSCFGLTVLHPDVFYPFRPYQIRYLFSREWRPPSYWDRRLGNASAVHFFRAITNLHNVSRDAGFDLYSYLAPKHCPISYQSTQKF